MQPPQLQQRRAEADTPVACLGDTTPTSFRTETHMLLPVAMGAWNTEATLGRPQQRSWPLLRPPWAQAVLVVGSPRNEPLVQRRRPRHNRPQLQLPPIARSKAMAALPMPPPQPRSRRRRPRRRRRSWRRRRRRSRPWASRACSSPRPALAAERRRARARTRRGARRADGCSTISLCGLQASLLLERSLHGPGIPGTRIQSFRAPRQGRSYSRNVSVMLCRRVLSLWYLKLGLAPGRGTGVVVRRVAGVLDDRCGRWHG
mmetsp:Transcript_107092/g.341784  ORF Transcript_107092/g.341784 Transcript_107092/m.341784 type:complete len:259 (+) Transcript_107092:451-1227(+)